MRITKLVALLSLGLLALGSACDDASGAGSAFDAKAKAGSGGSGPVNTAGQSNGNAGNTGNAGGSNQGMGGGIIIDPMGGAGANPGGPCTTGPDTDTDGDGWTQSQGDCNDCDPNVNPGAIDIVNYAKDSMGMSTKDPLPAEQQIDEDCDGTAHLPGAQTSCDKGLGVAPGDAFEAARAMGLCNVKVEENPADPKQRKWGVIQAGFNRISGGFLKDPLQIAKNVGILPDFGGASKPREGERVFALSTGEARAQGHNGFTNNTCGQSGFQFDNFPPGFPKDGSCGETGSPFDGVALDLKIRVPTNAKTVKFNFRFFTCEFPVYVCEQYNDVFAVLMTPNPLPTNHNMYDPGSMSANIAFEALMNNPNQGNVIGVNNQSFLTACSGGVSGYNNCKGEGELNGSGFEGHAASAWLQSQVPVPSGKIVYLRFAIWDSGDGALDSSAIVDNFQWSADEGTGVVTVIDPDID